jgi:hypothetical protein
LPTSVFGLVTVNVFEKADSKVSVSFTQTVQLNVPYWSGVTLNGEIAQDSPQEVKDSKLLS